ncbi:DUF924 family protein [Tabrizicola sp.]|jgi:uncharacterized protein (DUF924 family)|uniref:DUF924 family protein n=1 Tax=Tabrizicola sp. TaxID=2005166 RepID=UPI0025CD33BC|nr:DUF924 family protein [Tabrizicola sp.]MBY0352483.1 DUF924 domain-containing protein [Tabrizicola sp.]MDK2775352.1 DUF924 domain-containing protein [Tabrizicola sp.]
MSDPIGLLEFWLHEVGPQGWYAGGEDIDTLCRDRFADLWQAARDGGLEHWVDGTVGTLAYLILTDQIPRNIHRGTSLAFATDPQARAAARKALAAGWDIAAPEPERQFFYMPFEHSEDSSDQALSVQLLTERLASDSDMALHARAHQQVIFRFGRFPTRNGPLGRTSSAEEQAYLDQGGYAAVVARLKSHASGA